ncbi:MAG: S9 family peptidase, partial [Bacteroidota bacterium]
FGVAVAGNRIWLALDVKVKDFNGKEIYKDLPKTSGRIYDDLMFRHWDRWDDGVYSHVHIADISNGVVGTPKDIMAGEAFDSPLKPNGGEEEIAWSPDGNTLAYTCKKSTGVEYATTTNSDIYLYDVLKGATSNLTSGMMGYDKVPSFSPDGSKIAWISQEEAGNEADRMRLYVHEFASGAKRELSKGYDQNIESIAWSRAGEKIYFLSPTMATQQVFVYDFKAKETQPIRQLTNDIAEHTEVSLGYDSKKKEDVVVTSRMSISAPAEVFRIDLKTGANQPVSTFNKELMSSLKLGKVEKRMVRATDGKEILTWVVTPPDMEPGKKYPALLYCQGGPQSMVGQFWSYRWNFQLMAANGYVVVAPNRRGLPGFGSEWNDAISGDWGGQAMKDLLSAIDSVSNESYVDRNRMGAVGASFGGYSVYWLAGNHSGRFKAFISHNGVYNMRSMLATEELFFYQHENQAYPWEKKNEKAFTQFSPDSYVDRWTAPILVIANEKDYRVPYTQGLEAFTAARVRGVSARLLTFPDENHWVLKPQNGVLWQRVFYGWLDKYLK